MARTRQTEAATAAPAVVTKAAVRAADKLGLTSKILARIIGVSEPSVSRMRRGDYLLSEGDKPFELAVLFIHLYRSLDAIVGGDDAVANAWLKNPNTTLQAAPVDLFQNVHGRTDVIQYLDARRAVV
jgi:hypothetical protein